MIRKHIDDISRRVARRHCTLLLLLLTIVLANACARGNGETADGNASSSQVSAGGAVVGPQSLTPVPLAAGERLQVAATTSIIGDVVAQIGGDRIALFTIIPPGVDPHSYTPTPQDLRALTAVDVIFVNGLHLEEGLQDLLGGADAPQVVVNTGVELLHGGDGHDREADSASSAAEEHDHGEDDPHTWQSVPNVRQWIQVIDEALGTLDPANRAAYREAASNYDEALAALDRELRAQIDTPPQARRKLVTDHESFNYFAHTYGFTVIGAVIPSLSSLAESSAQELAALQDQIAAEKVPAIFVSATANANMADQLARDLNVAVVPLYSDALSIPSGPAATYLAFMRYNVQAIVTALQE